MKSFVYKLKPREDVKHILLPSLAKFILEIDGYRVNRIFEDNFEGEYEFHLAHEVKDEIDGRPEDVLKRYFEIEKIKD